MPEKSGRFDFIRADSNTDVTINMNVIHLLIVEMMFTVYADLLEIQEQ